MRNQTGLCLAVRKVGLPSLSSPPWLSVSVILLPCRLSPILKAAVNSEVTTISFFPAGITALPSSPSNHSSPLLELRILLPNLLLLVPIFCPQREARFELLLLGVLVPRDEGEKSARMHLMSRGRMDIRQAQMIAV